MAGTIEFDVEGSKVYLLESTCRSQITTLLARKLALGTYLRYLI